MLHINQHESVLSSRQLWYCTTRCEWEHMPQLFSLYSTYILVCCLYTFVKMFILIVYISQNFVTIVLLWFLQLWRTTWMRVFRIIGGAVDLVMNISRVGMSCELCLRSPAFMCCRWQAVLCYGCWLPGERRCHLSQYGRWFRPAHH